VKRVPNQTKGGDLYTSKQFGPKRISRPGKKVTIWSIWSWKNIRRGIFYRAGMFRVTFTDMNALLNIKTIHNISGPGGRIILIGPSGRHKFKPL